jgi:Ca2+-binding RTX toxin-like protein
MLFPNTVAHQRETVNLLKAGVSNMLNLVSSIKDKYFPGKSRRRRTGRPERRRRSGAGPESLEERTLLAAEIGVAWNPDVMSYKLDITGTESDDVITVEIEQGVPNQIHAEVKDDVGNVLAEATYNAGMFYEVSIAGLGGDDTIISDTGLTEYIFAGDGNDDVWGGDGHDTLLGGYGVDILYGSTGNDSLMGSDGNDFIYGSEGDDYLNGGFGHDIMTGGNGTDFLHGDNGADILLGEGGTDYLFGDAGADFLNGGTGNDHLEGGTGADTLVQHMQRFNFGGGMWWWLPEDALNDYDSDDDSLLNVFHNW